MWRYMRRERYNQTTILMLGCAAFLGGLALSRRVGYGSGLPVLATAIVGLLTFRLRSIVTVVALLALGLSLGIWRGTAYQHALQPYHRLAFQEVTFTGTSNIDAVYAKQGQISFVVRDVHFTNPLAVKPPGTVKVSGFGEVMVYRGDQVQVSGKLYPTRGANQAVVAYAQLHKVGGRTTVIDNLRRKFTAGMQTALPEPLASFGLGLLVGQRNTLPPEITQALLMVGLTHIIAVSGYNLTILLEAARRLFGNRSKVLSTVIALLLITGFLLIAGTSASIVRAAVISLLGLAAWYYGRSIRPVLLILLAAAGTTYANPTYLWADIGWYLSFLAFFGILVLGPITTGLIYKHRTPPLLGQIMIESLCAEVMTVPLVLYIFGQFSLVSLLANLLIVALIPLAMLCSFVAGLAGMLAGAVSGWIAWPALVLLTYMLDIVGLLSRIPHVFQQHAYLSVIDMGMLYSTLVIMLLLSYRRRRRNWYDVAQTWRSVVIKPTGND